MRDIAPAGPDEDVLRIATQLAVPVITMDVGFARLVFLNRLVVPGVLLLRLHGLSWDDKADRASQAITAAGDRLVGSFVVANHQAIRVRALPEPAD
jgi:hypothetical protein